MKSPATRANVKSKAESHNALLALGFGYCPGEEQAAPPIGPTIVVVSFTAADAAAVTRPMTPAQLCMCLKKR